jgi:hypothetical protein
MAGVAVGDGDRQQAAAMEQGSVRVEWAYLLESANEVFRADDK